MKSEEKAQVQDAPVVEAGAVDPAAVDPTVETEAASPASSLNLDQLKADAAKAKEYYDKLLRTAADFDNFRKRAARERQEAVAFANESLLEKLLPVLDAFDMAQAAAGTAQVDGVQSFQTGLNLIQQQLKKVLSDAGLEEISALNQPFDPNLHEALMQQESAEVPEGQVLQQVRKGYKLRERLIRPASVIVAKQPAAKP